MAVGMRSEFNQQLWEINPVVGTRRVFPFNSRWDQVAYARCRIGQVRLTRQFLLSGENSSKCPTNYPLNHVLLDCHASTHLWNQYYMCVCVCVS